MKSLIALVTSVLYFYFVACSCVAIQAASPKDPALRAAILKREKEDQDARFAWIAFMKKHQGEPAKPDAKKPKELDRMNRVDATNRAWLKKVIDKYGWPGKTLVGEDGAESAWLLVQHADEDRPFQKKCLALMEEAVKKGEARGDDLAYLTDRVLVGEGKPQRYGTQTKILNGEIRPDPVEDEANLDKRRAELGMMPMAEYLKRVREMYLGKK
jgi:hypothetical protein